MHAAFLVVSSCIKNTNLCFTKMIFELMFTKVVSFDESLLRQQMKGKTL